MQREFQTGGVTARITFSAAEAVVKEVLGEAALVRHRRPVFSEVSPLSMLPRPMVQSEYAILPHC
jgi:hypothetical protein